MSELTHKIEIIISSNYTHGPNQYASVSLSGNGGLTHMVEAFQAALLAAGFAISTVQKLGEVVIKNSTLKATDTT